MKKVLAVFLSALILALCLAGCGKKEEVPQESIAIDSAICGTWMEDYWDSGYTFNEDGTGKDIFWNQDFTYTTADGIVTISYVEGLWAEKEFAYAIGGNILTMTEVLQPAEDGTVSGEAGTWDYTKQE